MRILSFIVVCLLTACTTQKPTASVTTPPTPSVAKASKTAEPKSLITDKTVSDDGIFKVHKNESTFLFEIPSSLLGKDMLWVTRIAKIPANLSPYMNAGSKTNQQVVRWEQKDDKILLKSISYNAVAADSLPIYESVKNNNFFPILASFDIKQEATDSTGLLIEVNDIFENDIPAFSGMNSRLKKQYKVSGLDKKRSFVDGIKSFPKNIEVKHTMTYKAGTPPSNSRSQTLTMQMNQSMILLPEEPMTPRLYDDRVGWFTTKTIDYSSDELKADEKTFIRKWKLIPKDKAAYLRGELVEPVKPIVYYIDPATPEKFRPYFKQGIEDWNEAFAAAGFKNAIIAKYPPSAEEDPDFSPEDTRYSVVRYVASTTRNAVGPSVSDPRTGEILESDIIWYHNHLRSYRNRYMLETGAANPKARTLDTPKEEIGEMMRRVISHEVGHALGLPHNMKASAAYPTDSLRSGSFSQKYGIATTIMDYARYNYIAQPGDEGIRFIRQIGPYDLYCIEYGYRWYPDVTDPEDEKAILHAFVSKHADNPIYQFGSGRGRFDPNSQTESIGDDAVKASSYGKSNLKIVAKNLVDWVATDEKDYTDLSELYGELLGVWNRYVGHVSTNIGGVYETRKTHDMGGVVYTTVPKDIQKRSVRWLNENAFQDLGWLMDKQIIDRISYDGVVSRMSKLQTRQLSSVLNESKMMRLIEQSASDANAYSLSEMLDDLNNGIWSDVFGNTTSPDALKRNLQREYLEQVKSMLMNEKSDAKNSDVPALLKFQLRKVATALAKKRSTGMVSAHYADIQDRIKDILDGEE